MAELIEASADELESSVLELNATERAEELTDLIQELSASHIQDWSDEKRDKFALKLSKQLERSEARKEFPPQVTLQTAIDTLDFDGNSYLVCCYEFIPNKTKSSVEPKPYKNIGKYNLLLVWKTRGYDPRVHAIQDGVQVKANFDGKDCFFPHQECGNICVLHHRGVLRQDSKVNKGYSVRKYRLVEIIEDAPHAKKSSASKQHPQPMGGDQRAEDIASEVGNNPNSFNSVAEQLNNAFPLRPPNGAGNPGAAYERQGSEASLDTSEDQARMIDDFGNMLSSPLGASVHNLESFDAINDDFGSSVEDLLNDFVFDRRSQRNNGACFSQPDLDVQSMEFFANPLVAPPFSHKEGERQDGASIGTTTEASEVSNSVEALEKDDHETAFPGKAVVGTQSSLMATRSNESISLVVVGSQDVASNDTKMKDAVLTSATSGAQGAQDKKITSDDDPMGLQNHSYPYEIFPNNRFFKAVKTGCRTEVAEMIEADSSVVNSCNLERTVTALQLAAYVGRSWMVTKLLEHGANPCPRLPKSSLDWARHSPLEIVTQFRIREEVVKIIRLYYKNNEDKFVFPRDKDAIEEFKNLPSINKSFRSVLLGGLRLPNVYLENYKEELSIDELLCLGKFVKKYDQETNSSASNRLKISYSDPGEDSRFLAMYYTVHDREMLNDALMHWKEGASKKYEGWNCVNDSCPCRGHGSPWNRSQSQRPKT